jgi:hypothetical protein
MLKAAASDEQVRELAAQILARPKYAHWRAEGRLGTLQHLLDLLARFLEWLRNLADTQPLLYLLLMLLLFASFAALLTHIVYTMRIAMRRRAPVVSAPPAPPGLLDQALALAGAGMFLDAAHLMQLAVIELLLQRGILELARSEPNRTLRERLRRADLPPTERGELTRLLDQLERQWFRDRSADQSSFEAWRSLYARLAGSAAAS